MKVSLRALGCCTHTAQRAKEHPFRKLLTSDQLLDLLVIETTRDDLQGSFPRTVLLLLLSFILRKLGTMSTLRTSATH